MATENTITGRDSDKFMLRFPDGMRIDVKSSAEANGRTMNAEIVARLRASFEGHAAALPQAVRDAVADEVEARGGTPDEALTRLVLAGQSKGGTVFQVTLLPGTKLQDVTALLEAARNVIPPDADVIIEQQ